MILLDDLRTAHAEAVMVGWDFRRFDGRLVAADPPWDFETDCARALVQARHVADLGTGGGERLIALLETVGAGTTAGQDRIVVATEGWPPNVDVARRELAPRGVAVRTYDAEQGEAMPFADGSLDLVMARHEAFDAAEVARVLAPGGVLLTQQVGGDDVQELRDWFGGEPAYPDVRLEVFVADVAAAGLQVRVAEDWSGPMSFADPVTLVEYLALTPWDVEGFSVDAHATTLLELAAVGPLTVTQRRFRLHAVKPAPEVSAAVPGVEGGAVGGS